MNRSSKTDHGGSLEPKIKKPKILVLYYSLYGHLSLLADAISEGIELAGGEPVVRQAAEIIPEELWNDAMKHAKKKMKKIPIADPEHDLENVDGVVLGSPTRFGGMAVQIKAFLDQTSAALSKGYLAGKPAGVFTSSSTQHGGNETTLIGMIVSLMHHGCVIVGLPFNELVSSEGLKTVEEVSGGSPYGASTITGQMGERLPSRNELMLARSLGQYVTLTASKLMNRE